MKRKTAIELCIDVADVVDEWAGIDLRECRAAEGARKEFLALLALARACDSWVSVLPSVAGVSPTGRATLRLRRLGLLPPRKP